ncbi:MAG: DUF5686 family protein [Bacteroidales bacterium]|nr:DUF5686 family protein [Bacteroidales bacterium]
MKKIVCIGVFLAALVMKIAWGQQGLEVAKVGGTRVDTTFEIGGVEIIGGRDPAYRIMENVYNAGARNKIPSHKYTAYDKMYISFNEEKTSEALDPNMYMFFMESITNGEYAPPDKRKETVTASKMSGIKNLPVDLIVGPFMLISIYDDNLVLLDKEYLSPLSKRSIFSVKPKYYFHIEDTVSITGTDTVFHIAFRPIVNSQFNGVSGFFNVSSEGWGLRNLLVATNAYTVSQDFELVCDTLPFPAHTEVIALMPQMRTVSDSLIFIPQVVGERFYYNMDFDIERDMRFSKIEFQSAPGADDRTDTYWDHERPGQLTEREKKTYYVVDSLSRATKMDKKMILATAMLIGRIPVWKIDLVLEDILRYNVYEGFYLGVGLEVGQRVLRVAKVGGRFGYGIRDKSLKWGVDGEVTFHKDSDSKIKVSYFNDLQAVGGDIIRSGDFSFFDPNNYADFFWDRMDRVRGVNFGITTKAVNHLTFDVGMDVSSKHPCYDYSYIDSDGHGYEEFKLSKIHAMVRFAYRETFLPTKYGLISKGTRYPVIFLRYERGISGLFGSGFSYNKIAFRVSGTVPVSTLATFVYTISGGYIDSNVPYCELFSCPASYYKYTLYAPTSFATMRLNEFVSDRYLAAFLRFDFNPFIKTGVKWLNPRPSICFNYGIGTIGKDKIESHRGVSIKTMDKGYCEAGLNINGLLDFNVYSIGLGVFYRLGYYSFDKVGDNFAYKLTIVF